MPTRTVGDIAMHYETMGTGDPLVLIPYLSADHACYAFQTPEYSQHFTCVALDLRGAGESDKPEGPYAEALGSVTEFVIQAALPWCFTPEFFAEKADVIAGLEAFVRSRPRQPVDAFLRQTEAVLGHDAQVQLGRIGVPTQVTFGRWDQVTSTRFAPALTGAIKGAELVVFEHVSHLGLHEDAEGFNRATLEFLTRQKL
jgi:pimeloyl-ACP methyl ester carboxylesterase